jgi:cyclohexa-1,5-dienecarbonyl-CoA hydratase
VSEGVRVSVDGAVLRITLDRPPLNVLTTAMLVAIAEALEQASGHPEVRVVRLDAAGRAFSAGVDVADHVDDRIAPMMDALARLFETFDAFAVPVVSVVQGAALGGGMELVLGADLVWASDRATFGQPEVRLGLFAPPASVLLPRLVGERRAAELLLTGEPIAAEEAERIGLVHRVVPHDRLEEEAQTRIARLLELSGAALRQAKAALRPGRSGSVAEGLGAVDRLYRDELMRTADAHEGLAAFQEKRPPRWKHA